MQSKLVFAYWYLYLFFTHFGIEKINLLVKILAGNNQHFYVEKTFSYDTIPMGFKFTFEVKFTDD